MINTTAESLSMQSDDLKDIIAENVRNTKQFQRDSVTILAPAKLEKDAKIDSKTGGVSFTKKQFLKYLILSY